MDKDELKEIWMDVFERAFEDFYERLNPKDRKDVPIDLCYIQDSGLDPSLTFEGFKQNSSEYDVRALASLFADDDAKPEIRRLIVKGEQGKTHFLQAIGNLFCQKHPDAKIKYITAEEFAEKYVDSLRYHTLENLRREYGKLDLLLFDDLEMLFRKNSCEEVVRLFDALHDRNSRMVFASAEDVHELDLSDRLKNRLSSCFPVDLKS